MQGRSRMEKDIRKEIIEESIEISNVMTELEKEEENKGIGYVIDIGSHK